MTDIDIEDFRAFVRGRANCYRTTEIDHDTAINAVVNMCEHDVPPLLNELDRLQAENQRLREHIQYYSYCTRQGVRATEASYIEWEDAHKSLGFDIP